MKENSLGITGKIGSVPFAKKVIYIAGVSAILLQVAWILHGGFMSAGVTIPLVGFLLYFKARGAALALFLWIFFLHTVWTIIITIPMLLDGRFLRAYLPIFCFIVLWLQYRAIRATVFLNVEDAPEIDVGSLQDVFE